MSKIAVANAITAAFYDYNSDLSLDEKQNGEQTLKDMMSFVVAGTTPSDFQDQIAQFVGNYQNITTSLFSVSPYDDLEGSDSSATIFKGTINLINPENSTIASTDSIVGSAEYTNTLKINVISDNNHNVLNLNNELPSTTNIQKLEVNNGSAKVTGTLSGGEFSKSAEFTGKGDVELKITGKQEVLSVATATKGESIITIGDISLDNVELQNYNGGEGADIINVEGAIFGNTYTKGGNDKISMSGYIQNNSIINLGAGDDIMEIYGNVRKDSLGKIAKEPTITLDGGAGNNDMLDIRSYNIDAVKSIIGFEKIHGFNTATVSIEALNGLNTTLDGTLNATANGKTNIDLSKIKAAATANVKITHVTNETITLNNKITESITLEKNAKNVHINEIDKENDIIAGFAKAPVVIETKGSTEYNGLDFSKASSAIKAINPKGTAPGGFVLINDQADKKSYIWAISADASGEILVSDLSLVASFDTSFTNDEVAKVFMLDKPWVFDFKPGQRLDYSTGKYGDEEIDKSKTITINGIDGEFKVFLGPTNHDLELFMLTGGSFNSSYKPVLSSKTIVYLGGKRDENGAVISDDIGFDLTANTIKD